MTKLRNPSTVVCGLLLAFSATQAEAVLITEWEYEFQSGFAAFSPAAPDQNSVPNDTTNNGAVGSVPNPGLGGLPTVLSWGESVVGPSQLSIDPTVSSPPSLFTNSTSVIGPAITYSNSVITPLSIELDSVTSATTLLLTPITPPSAPIGPVPILFNFLAGTASTGGDVLVVEDPGTLAFDFVIDDFQYTVGFELAGLTQLSDTDCSNAGGAVNRRAVELA